MSKKTSLLEESTIRHFGKLAGLAKPITDKFLKENESTRGATFDPTGTDERFDNLKEGDDVTEEGKDLEQEGKDLEQEGKDLEQEGLDLEQEGKELEQEAKSLTAKKPTKIKGGQGEQKLKPAKTSSKNSVKEGLDDLEVDDGSGMPPQDDGMGMEPEMEEPALGGGGDVAGLVKAIADAISAHTGVQVDVEGAGVESGEEEGLPPPEGEEPSGLEGGDDSGPSLEDDEPLEETGIVSYKTEDPMAKRQMGQVAESKKRKDALVAEITKKVLSRLSQVTKAKQTAVKPVAQKITSKIAKK